MYMELIEWAGFLRALQLKFEEIAVAKEGYRTKKSEPGSLYLAGPLVIKSHLYFSSSMYTLAQRPCRKLFTWI
jgi:hypothetical protein